MNSRAPIQRQSTDTPRADFADKRGESSVATPAETSGSVRLPQGPPLLAVGQLKALSRTVADHLQLLPQTWRTSLGATCNFPYLLKPGDICQAWAFLRSVRFLKAYLEARAENPLVPSLPQNASGLAQQYLAGLSTLLSTSLHEGIADWRRRISSGEARDFHRYLSTHVAKTPQGTRTDSADLIFDLVSGLPRTVGERSGCIEMHCYEPTPLRLILSLMHGLSLTAEDHVFDLGSGRGRVVAAVRLFSEATASGVEFQTQLHAEALAAQRNLSLQRANFINEDARTVNFGNANIFYLFNPFAQPMLAEVLDRLREHYRSLHASADRRRFIICSLCGSSVQLQKESWLQLDPSTERADIQRFTPR